MMLRRQGGRLEQGIRVMGGMVHLDMCVQLMAGIEVWSIIPAGVTDVVTR
jgi:hypothetical protein